MASHSDVSRYYLRLCSRAWLPCRQCGARGDVRTRLRSRAPCSAALCAGGKEEVFLHVLGAAMETPKLFFQWVRTCQAADASLGAVATLEMEIVSASKGSRQHGVWDEGG